MGSRSIETFIEYAERTGIVGRVARRGCSDTEIAALEEAYGLTLPHSYRCYLSVMGHSASRLFSHDYIEVGYRLACTASKELPNAISSEYPDQHPQPPVCHPADGLIIASRLGDDHWFIRCDNPVDSRVWHLRTPGMTTTDSDDSFVEWLYGWICEAKRAIASGFYNQEF